jgi:hypothetical protein
MKRQVASVEALVETHNTLVVGQGDAYIENHFALQRSMTGAKRHRGKVKP